MTLPMVVGLFLSSIISGQIASSTGRWKAFPAVGLVLVAIGLFLLSRLHVDSSALEIGVYIAIMGAGLGMTMQMLVLAAQNAATRQDMAVSTSGVTFFRSLGGAVGVAAFGAILTNRVKDELAARLGGGRRRARAGHARGHPRAAAAGGEGGAGVVHGGDADGLPGGRPGGGARRDRGPVPQGGAAARPRRRGDATDPVATRRAGTAGTAGTSAPASKAVAPPGVLREPWPGDVNRLARRPRAGRKPPAGLRSGRGTGDRGERHLAPGRQGHRPPGPAHRRGRGGRGEVPPLRARRPPARRRRLPARPQPRGRLVRRGRRRPALGEPDQHGHQRHEVRRGDAGPPRLRRGLHRPRRHHRRDPARHGVHPRPRRLAGGPGGQQPGGLQQVRPPDRPRHGAGGRGGRPRGDRPPEGRARPAARPGGQLRLQRAPRERAAHLHPPRRPRPRGGRAARGPPGGPGGARRRHRPPGRPACARRASTCAVACCSTARPAPARPTPCAT